MRSRYRPATALPTTRTGGQGTPSRLRCGLISGYVFRLVREQLGLTQEGLAERFAVAPDTVAGWESGRRPLTAVAVAQIHSHRHRLLQMRAAPALLMLLDRALEADVMLAGALEERASINASPLGAWVMQRDLIETLLWPIIGVAPVAVRELPAPLRPRRGPVPTGPELAVADRRRFFQQMRRIADEAQVPTQFLLRRQALYLAGFDDRADTGEWLAYQQRTVRAGDWLTRWLKARSLAAVAARHGDRERMADFIATRTADWAGEAANLKYWAYWVGETSRVEPSDAFIAGRRLGSWRGNRLLRHLMGGLMPEHGYVELNVHTIRTLLAARPALLRARSVVRRLSGSLATLNDSGKLSASTRREIDSIRYAIRLAGHERRHNG